MSSFIKILFLFSGANILQYCGLENCDGVLEFM